MIFVARHLASSALLLLLIAMTVSPDPALARKKGESELEGTWFVVIHYTDESTANYEATRWLDRVWTFEMKGSRLLWTDYPIVVIEDTSGRFEAIQGNPRSRVLDGWEPNENQLADINGGPRVNTRGSRSKSLRGNDKKGWKSSGRNTVASASVVGYQENWSIQGEAGKRVFAFDEIFGNAVSDSAEGRTLYSESEISPSGKQIKGSYQRDDIRRGTFRMFRTKNVRSLKSQGKEKSVNERMNERTSKEWVDAWIKEETERRQGKSE